MAIRQISNGALQLYAKTATDASGKEVVVKEVDCVLKAVTINKTLQKDVEMAIAKPVEQRTMEEQYLVDQYKDVPPVFLQSSTQYILYDEKMNPIEDVCWYLNTFCADKSPNTRSNIATALRLLFVFCALFDIDWKQFPSSYVPEFKSFVKRMGPEYQKGTRTNITCNTYLSCIRGFYFAFGLSDGPLTRSRFTKAEVLGADGDARYVNGKKYDVAFKVDSKIDLRPDFNDKDDFDRFQKKALEKDDITAWILAELMFVHGFRIGECIGLTIEDIVTDIDETTGEIKRFLCIRNRKSDVRTRGQLAKGRHTPLAHESYSDTDYVKEYNKPSNLKCITEDFYNILKMYVESEHKRAAKEHPKRYATNVADIVNPEKFKQDWGLETNRYFFLNTCGNELHVGTWNDREKIYFHEIGKATDKGVRDKGLNHLWRHGVADHMVNKLGMSKHSASVYLGHKHESTTDIYLNPSVDELADQRRKVQQAIHKSIPYSDPVKAGILHVENDEKEED